MLHNVIGRLSRLAEVAAEVCTRSLLRNGHEHTLR